MEIYALFMFCGIFTTLLIPETKRLTLEQLAGEVPGTSLLSTLYFSWTTLTYHAGTPQYDPQLGHGVVSHARKSSDPSQEEAQIGEKGL